MPRLRNLFSSAVQLRHAILPHQVFLAETKRQECRAWSLTATMAQIAVNCRATPAPACLPPSSCDKPVPGYRSWSPLAA